jgi:hypothetical protein
MAQSTPSPKPPDLAHSSALPSKLSVGRAKADTEGHAGAPLYPGKYQLLVFWGADHTKVAHSGHHRLPHQQGL